METLRASRMASAIGVVLVLTFVVGLTVVGQQRGESKPTLKGVWRYVELTSTGPTARTTSNVPGLLVFTDRHFSLNYWPDVKPVDLPTNDKATDKDRADAWRGFFSRAGTYKVSGDVVAMKRTFVAAGFDIMRAGPEALLTWTYKVDGETLWLTQKANQTGPFANPATVKLVRLE